MRSPIWAAALYATIVVIGIVLGWQIDRRLGTHPDQSATIISI